MYLSGTFTFILVLELAVFEAQVEAFTIHRPSDTLHITRDPATAESVILEVRNDLRSDVKPIEIKNDSPPKTLPIQTTAKTEQIHKNDTSVMTNKTDISPNQSSKDVIPVGTYTTTGAPTTLKEASSTKAFINTTSTTVTEAYRSPNTTVTPTTTTVTTTIVSTPTNDGLNGKKAITTELSNVTLTTENDYLENNKSENNMSTTNPTSVKDYVPINNNTISVNKMQFVNTTSKPNTTNLVLSNNTSTTKTNSTLKSVTVSLNVSDKEFKLENDTGILNSTEANEINSKSVNSLIQTKVIVTTTEEPTTTILMTKNATANTVTSTTVENKNLTENASEHSSVKTVPYWKKYTTIERKRANITEENSTSTEKEDLLQSETTQTQTSISLDAINSYSDIPSLEELKNDLLKLSMFSTATGADETTVVETEALTTTTSTKDKLKTSVVDITTPSSETTIQTANVVSSKRAGFLNYSVKPTNRTILVKSNTTQEETVQNFTGTPYIKTTPASSKVQKSMTSQSQLVEDALNEELMKEEVLSDNVENAQRLREEHYGKKVKKVIIEQPPPEVSNEDKLRVKPISMEKTKTTSLYTVSPNYKPLKKIEVQPPKQFVRNPDDNSWRNESLSSLGIVFKANNSSKPFTQVLKNKTETEWNTLLEKYSKGEGPELRERLEKIAEMRKSKKKKINQFGEIVYTDYEEGVSNENLGSTNPTQKVENASFVLNDLTTPSPVVNEFESTAPNKMKKFLDDYEEDDESDYSLPNIDLKKYFTPTVATTRVPTKQSSNPVNSPSLAAVTTPYTYPPDRQPTLQYFPPKDKQQKVVIDDYDTVFQNKINSYTFVTPKKITNPEFPTTPRPPNDVTYRFPKNKYEQTNKPSDFVRHTNQMNKNIYITSNPNHVQSNTQSVTTPNMDHTGYNQAAYVIKHFRDFIDEVIKSDENPSSVTDEPMRGVTANGAVHQNKPKPTTDYYDYEAQFRKDVLSRFVENFNQNSERFKADFPVLYNTSIVHTAALEGDGGAESTAFMKRLYEDVQAFQYPKDMPKRDPHCDRTIELSPAYELHYYIPEEEEKEEIELKPATRPPYRLHL